MYDVNNIECIKRLKTYWIPKIIKVNDKVSLFYELSLVDSNNFGWQ